MTFHGADCGLMDGALHAGLLFIGQRDRSERLYCEGLWVMGS